MMWINPSNRLLLWDYDVKSGVSAKTYYGPYTGWIPASMTVGEDGNTRVVWVTNTGAISLWTIDRNTGAYTYKNYGPFYKWHFAALAIGADNMPCILWKNETGYVSIWKINGSSPAGYSFYNYGPLIHSATFNIVVGFDNIIHLLCNDGEIFNIDPVTHDYTIIYKGGTGYMIAGDEKADGKITSLWFSENTMNMYGFWLGNLDPLSMYESSLHYREPNVWFPAGLVSTPFEDHLLWFNATTGTVSLWNLDDAGGYTSFKAFYGMKGWIPVIMSAKH
jgi:hypothetical protein